MVKKPKKPAESLKDFDVAGLPPADVPEDKDIAEDAGMGINVEGEPGDEQGSIGSFIEYTISNALNRIGTGTARQDCCCCLVIIGLLRPYVDCIEKDKVSRPMEIDDAIDEMIDMAGVRINVRGKRYELVQTRGYENYINERYFYDLWFLASDAIDEATTNGTIRLQNPISVQYGAVLASQGGGFRPQKIVTSSPQF